MNFENLEKLKNVVKKYGDKTKYLLYQCGNIISLRQCDVDIAEVDFKKEYELVNINKNIVFIKEARGFRTLAVRNGNGKTVFYEKEQNL